MPFYFFLFLLFSNAVLAKPYAFKDEWVVSKGEQLRDTSWKEIAGNLKGSHEFVRAFGPGDRFGLFRKRNKSAKVEKLSLRGLILQPNYRYDSLDAQDPDVEKDWALKNTSQIVGVSESGTTGVDISAFPAWEIFKGSKKTVVAVLDTGIDFSHEDLKNNRWTNPNPGLPGDESEGFIDDLNGWNFVKNSNDIHDDNMHGTFCAGIIGADAANGKGSRGVNWQVSLMAVKILDENGKGSTERSVSGIQYAVNHGAKIINASWGGANYDQALYDTIKWAGERGVLFVAAAGNSSLDNDDGTHAIFPAGYRLKNILSVASYDNQDKIAKSSNYGKETTHIGAPGVQIFSTVPGGYYIGNGTSFAAPYVAGVAALLWGYIPALTFEGVKERILATSVPIHYYEKERTQTAGRVNAFNALKDERPPRPTLPKSWKRFPYTFSTAHPYNYFEKDSFKITHPGATHVRVHFKRFETESGNDLVTIKDANGKTVFVYSGEKNDDLSADALGDTLQLDFVADYAISGYGIDVDYYEVSQEP